MSTIFGLGSTDIFPQPGFNATQSQNGGWEGRHSFAIRRTAWNSSFVRSQFVNGTPITTLDSDLSSFFTFMVVSKVEVTSEEGDMIIVGVECAGGQASQFGDEGLGAGTNPTYRLSGSLQEAPFSQHPKWKALDEEQKTSLGLLMDGGLALIEDKYFIVDETLNEKTFADPIEDELEFAKLIAQGETTYLRPSITWTESTQGNSGLSTNQLNSLGKVSNPRGSPPEPSGTRDWMLTSAFQEENGNLYSTDLEWTLSEKEGFDAFLYDE